MPDSAEETQAAELVISSEFIERRIYLIRGQKVMLDSDLAELYDVPTHRLNEQVRRNKARFPEDFMFQLTMEETQALISQIAISKPGRGGRRKAALVFTEQGVAMLSGVLRSERAVQVNIAIMRAFVKLREILASDRGLARKLDDMEKKYDDQFRVVFEAIRELMKSDPLPPQRQIGFRVEEGRQEPGGKV